MKRRILAMMMVATMTVVMAGCGNTETAEETQHYVTASQEETAESNKAPGEKTVKTLTEVFNENDYSIWFVTTGVDKNTLPEVMILYSDGTYISCSSDGESGTGKRLGDYAQMSDEEILSLVEETTSSDKGAYTVSIWTDASGNKVEKEKVDFSNDGMWELEGYVGAQPIYDSYYGGYLEENGDVCITRTSSNIRFEFDAIGSDGVSVDEAISPSGASSDEAAAAGEAAGGN